MYSVRTFDTSGGAPKALAVSPDGSQVAVGVEGGYRVYAAFEGWSWREVETASAVVSLAFSWDGRLCYGTEDGVAIAGGAVVSRPKTRCVDWAPRGATASSIVAGHAGGVAVYEASDLSLVSELDLSGEAVDARFSPTGDRVAVASFVGKTGTGAFSLATRGAAGSAGGAWRTTRTWDRSKRVDAVAFSTARWVAFGDRDRWLVVLDAVSSDAVHEVRLEASPRSAAFSPEESTLSVVDPDGDVTIFFTAARFWTVASRATNGGASTVTFPLWSL